MLLDLIERQVREPMPVERGVEDQVDRVENERSLTCTLVSRPF
jgi:hypothetical protein